MIENPVQETGFETDGTFLDSESSVLGSSSKRQLFSFMFGLYAVPAAEDRFLTYSISQASAEKRKPPPKAEARNHAWIDVYATSILDMRFT